MQQREGIFCWWLPLQVGSAHLSPFATLKASSTHPEKSLTASLSLKLSEPWHHWTPTLLFFFMIIESASASADVITLFCLCWHVEGWNTVIEMHYHPSLNWDQSQAGLCKWTLIWESVCPGQRASSAKRSWLGSSHSEPRVSGSSSGEHVLVSMLELLCIFAPDSLHHPFGNRGGNWGICQHRDKKVVINSSWRKLSFLIVLQILCNGPSLRTVTMQINQVMTLAICASPCSFITSNCLVAIWHVHIGTYIQTQRRRVTPSH